MSVDSYCRLLREIVGFFSEIVGFGVKMIENLKYLRKFANN